MQQFWPVILTNYKPSILTNYQTTCTGIKTGAGSKILSIMNFNELFPGLSSRKSSNKKPGSSKVKKGTEIKANNQTFKVVTTAEIIKNNVVKTGNFEVTDKGLQQIKKTAKKDIQVRTETVKFEAYSDKANVLYGDGTKAIKDFIKLNFGSFNKFLKIDGDVLPGWVVSKKQPIADKLKSICNYWEQSGNKTVFYFEYKE
jgi:hypothetical protein